MHEDITEKLNRELQEPICSERQVVYILVEAHKLLEQEGVFETSPTSSYAVTGSPSLVAWSGSAAYSRSFSSKQVLYFIEDQCDGDQPQRDERGRLDDNHFRLPEPVRVEFHSKSHPFILERNIDK